MEYREVSATFDEKFEGGSPKTGFGPNISETHVSLFCVGLCWGLFLLPYNIHILSIYTKKESR